jgi:flagellar biogenesis protein FliO
MKLNIKKMKLNQVVLIIALIVVITWMVMRSKGRVEYNEGEKQMTQEELDTIMKFVKGTK